MSSIVTPKPFLDDQFFANLENAQSPTSAGQPLTDSIESAAPITCPDIMAVISDIVCLPVRAVYVLFVWLSRCFTPHLPAEMVEAQKTIEQYKTWNPQRSSPLLLGSCLVAYYSARYPFKREQEPSYAELLFPGLESFKPQMEDVTYDQDLVQAALSSLYSALPQKTQNLLSDGDPSYKTEVIDCLLADDTPPLDLEERILERLNKSKIYCIAMMYKLRYSDDGVAAFVDALFNKTGYNDPDASEEALQTAMQRIWSNAPNAFKVAVIVEYQEVKNPQRRYEHLAVRLEKLGIPL